MKKIKAGEAPLAAGKTYSAIKRSLRNLEAFKTTLLLVPSHATAKEATETIYKQGLPTSAYSVVLQGKRRNETCLPEHADKACNRCPIFKEAHRLGEPIKEQILKKAAGRALTLPDLLELGREFGVCAVMLSRLLANMKSPHIVVAPHAYLVSNSAFNILVQIEHDECIVDEADQLADTLRSEHQHEWIFATARGSKSKLWNGRCNRDCGTCKLHLADHVYNDRIGPFAGRREVLDGISSSINAMELLEPALTTIEDGIKESLIRPIFDISAIREFMGSFLEILGNPKDDDSSIKALERIEKNPAAIALSERQHVPRLVETRS